MVTPKPSRSTLLVSARSIDEAAMAVAEKVDVLDFKDPAQGPLAAVDPGVWEVAAETFPHADLSAALGESVSARKLSHRVPAAFRYAKVGPSGLLTAASLQNVWNSLDLAAHTELVPVAYADHQEADCVDVDQVLSCVIATGRKRMLVDTFSKQGKSLIDYLPAGALAGLIQRAHLAEVWIALAGSVQLPQVKELQSQGIAPDCWGVRGDVCRNHPDPLRQRQGELDRRRIASWKRALA